MIPSTSTPKWIIVLLASIVALTPLSIDMYLPAMATIANDLDSHIGHVQQSLSTYLAGLGMGMLLFGPLADKYGRRPLALLGLGGFFVVSLLIYTVESVEAFIALRFLQAFIGAAATVVVPGIIRHLYQENTAKGLSYVAMIMMIAPMIAPSIGSLLLLVGEWRLIFLVTSIYSLLIFLLALRFLPEIPRSEQTRNANILTTLSSYSIIFKQASARPMILCMLFCALALFSYVTGISFVYITYFGVSETAFGLLFGLTIASIYIGNFINTRLVPRWGSLKILKRASILAVVFSGAQLIALALHSPLYVVVIIILLIMPCISVLSINCDALIIMNFPHNTGTATAVTGTVRYVGGAFAGPLLALLYTGTPMPLAALMFLGSSGVFVSYLWYRSQLK